MVYGSIIESSPDCPIKHNTLTFDVRNTIRSLPAEIICSLKSLLSAYHFNLYISGLGTVACPACPLIVLILDL